MKGLLYYTSHDCDKKILLLVRENLLRVCGNNRIVSVSLKPLCFGDENVTLLLEKSPLTMYKQILAGLEKLDTAIVFLVEHDVFYPKCHFDFEPSRKDVFYYNENWWKVRVSDGQVVQWKAVQVSGLCAYRSLLIEHYIKRIERTERGFSNRVGFEPGLHKFPRGIDNYGMEIWRSKIPYVDMCHEKNVTKSKFVPDPRLENYIMSDEVPYWGRTKGRVTEFLDDIERRK